MEAASVDKGRPASSATVVKPDNALLFACRNNDTRGNRANHRFFDGVDHGDSGVRYP